MEIALRLTDERSYFRFLAETVNLVNKYKKPDRVIRGRELDLLTLMADASERFPTLRGAGFKEWLMEEGGFTANDIYRYTSSLTKKGWITEGFIKSLPNGKFHKNTRQISGAVEAYLLPNEFDKKSTGLQSKIMLNVDGTDTGGEA